MEDTALLVKPVEKVKDWYERISGRSIYPITNYIRKAGYYTKIHISGLLLFGEYKSFRIVGSKNRRGLRYSGGSDEPYPKILVSVSDIKLIGESSEMNIICPPDPDLEKLETIVADTFRKIFQERDLQKKDWYERRSGLSVYPITNYIRKAGYYTKIHISGLLLFGEYKSFRIVGSKDRKGLRYSEGSDEVYPEVLISVSDTEFIGKHSEIKIVCPPDLDLEKLETIVADTFREIFQEQDLQKDKP